MELDHASSSHLDSLLPRQGRIVSAGHRMGGRRKALMLMLMLMRMLIGRHIAEEGFALCSKALFSPKKFAKFF